jgi:hypothetical protein
MPTPVDREDACSGQNMGCDDMNVSCNKREIPNNSNNNNEKQEEAIICTLLTNVQSTP